MAITKALAANTGQSLTAACGNGVRQAAHRIFEDPATSVKGLLAGHYAATQQRCLALPRVLIAQDTTFFTYAQAQITGLGILNGHGKTRGLLAHSALAMTEDGTPLGLLHLQVWGASDPEQLPPQGQQVAAEERESYKWQQGLEGVAEHLSPQTSAVLIQDREGDFYDFLAAPRPANIELLVRAAQNRRSRVITAAGAVLPTPEKLLHAVAGTGRCGTLLVSVPRKARNPHQILPPRREAELEVRVIRAQIRRPNGSKVAAATLEVWVIEAEEKNTPEGEPPLRWVLITTAVISTLEEACLRVRWYARRWLIERLHFTLKSGLRAERLQIDDATSLGHALAIYFLVAQRLLYLTYVAREDPDRPAGEVLAADELTVLAARRGSPIVTLQEAIREVAVIGGYQYYRTAPPPGVKSLWLGWRHLTGMVEGWRLARRAGGLNCDA